GARVIAEGPAGGLTRTRAKLAMIAGGVGIAPVRALLEDTPGDVAVVYRAAEPVLFRDELDALARRRGAAPHSVSGDGAALAAAPDAVLHGVSERRPRRPGRVRSGLSEPQTTPFSFMQVRVTFTGRELTRVETVQMTASGARTQAIDARAEPILRAEALRKGG